MAKCLNCFDNPAGKAARVTVAGYASRTVEKTIRLPGQKRLTYKLVKTCQAAQTGGKMVRAAQLVGNVGQGAILIEGTFAWTSLALCEVDCADKPLWR